MKQNEILISKTENDEFGTIEEAPTPNQQAEALKAETQIDKFDKFKDADAVFKAYKSLESEFTKKCQELKQKKAQEEEILFRAESLKNEVSILQEKLENAYSGDDFTKAAMSDKGIFTACIEKFLNAKREVTETVVPILKGSTGRAALVTISRPKTLEEAGRIAGELLRRGQI